jgi:ribose-phosphate pyrophosphokinase
MILGFDDYESQGRELANALGWQYGLVKRHQFPDGETRITLPTSLPQHVVFCRSLDHPNQKLVELMLAAKTARELGVSRLSLVAPYLCYMRQDMAFYPGEAVSQRIVGQFLAELFDDVITVNPHLHRITALNQAIPSKQAMALSTTSVTVGFLADELTNPVILGPDSESEPWVRAVAAPNGWQYGVCQKKRKGDESISISLPEIELRDREIVFIDDIISSGQTIAVAAQACLTQNAKSVDVFITHGLFSSGAEQRIQRAGVRHIWSTDSVSHETNVVSLVDILKDAVLALGARVTQA